MRLKSKGDFSKTLGFLSGLRTEKLARTEEKILENYADKIIKALSVATPKDTGETSKSWRYEIVRNGDKVSLNVYNSNVNNGVNIALILQYGHSSKSGKYVPGIDYINPALQPLFDEMENDFWKEATHG